jgi:hypothetical protein
VRADESLHGADRRSADQDGVVIGVDVNHRGMASLAGEPFGVSRRDRLPGPWSWRPGPTDVGWIRLAGAISSTRCPHRLTGPQIMLQRKPLRYVSVLSPPTKRSQISAASSAAPWPFAAR